MKCFWKVAWQVLTEERELLIQDQPKLRRQGPSAAGYTLVRGLRPVSGFGL